MHKSPIEKGRPVVKALKRTQRQLSGGAPEDKKGRDGWSTKPVREFRKNIFFLDCFLNHNLTETQMQTYLTGEKNSSGSVRKWKSGEHTASEKKLNAIATAHRQSDPSKENSDFIHEYPLFELLIDRPISIKKLEKLRNDYLVKRDIPGLEGLQFSCVLGWWDFPLTQNGEPDGAPTPPVPNSSHFPEVELKSFFHRGDWYGFMGILFAIRFAESEHDTVQHLTAVQYGYQAFAGAARNPVFQPHWKALYELFRSIVWRVPSTVQLLMPIDEIIREQIEADEHSVNLYANVLDKTLQKPNKPKLPYEMATFPSERASL